MCSLFSDEVRRGAGRIRTRQFNAESFRTTGHSSAISPPRLDSITSLEHDITALCSTYVLFPGLLIVLMNIVTYVMPLMFNEKISPNFVSVQLWQWCVCTLIFFIYVYILLDIFALISNYCNLLGIFALLSKTFVILFRHSICSYSSRLGTVKDGPENLLRDEDEIDPEDLSICLGGGHTV